MLLPFKKVCERSAGLHATLLLTSQAQVDVPIIMSQSWNKAVATATCKGHRVLTLDQNLSFTSFKQLQYHKYKKNIIFFPTSSYFFEKDMLSLQICYIFYSWNVLLKSTNFQWYSSKNEIETILKLMWKYRRSHTDKTILVRNNRAKALY